MMSLAHYQQLQREAARGRLDRTGYHALRHERRALARELRLNPRPFTTGCDENAARADAWDRKRLRLAYLNQLLPSWQIGEGDVLDGWQRARRGRVEQAARQRRLNRLAAAIDTTGMSPIQAAWARLQISFGGQA